MTLNFNNGILKEFTVVLCKRNYDKLGILRNVEELNCKQNMNSANEISFKVSEYTDGIKNELWEDIYDLRLVWIKELDEYYQIEVSYSDSYPAYKSITGTSLCEAELSQTILRNIEINTSTDIERDTYSVAHFYDQTGNCVLQRVLSKVPNYSIGHVDDSLKSLNLVLEFSINGTSVYDFLTGECSEQYNCLFTFDSSSRTINVYDLYTTCKACGYRGEFNDVCPECGSNNISYYGNDTTILVSKDNLTDEITYSADVGQIKNCFYLEGGDDDMTAAIVNSNPNGSQYIYYLPEETLNDMSDELRARLSSYNTMYNSYKSSYSTYVANLYEALDKILYYQTEMMPSSASTKTEITASTEAKKLTKANLDGTALSSVTSTTAQSSVENALKNYAKIFIKSGYVKISKITTTSWTPGNGEGTWVGNFTVQSFSDENDKADSSTLTLKIKGDYQNFINQKVLKKLQEKDKNGYIYDVLGNISTTTLAQFKESIKYYSYDMLKDFADSLGAGLTVMQDAGQSKKGSDMYSTFYKPYYQRQQACISEMKTRQKTIDSWDAKRQTALTNINNVHNALNFEKYLGETLFNEFCNFRREDTYSNSNYISDGLENSELLSRAKEFLDEAQKEIVKSGEYQYSISSNLKNLLLIPEFSPIVDNFELGNWIRFRIDDDIYRLRLISYTIDFSNIQNINTEFSTLTKTHNGYNDVKSILDSASSMSSSYSYVQSKADKGDDAYEQYTDWVSKGLDSANTLIKSNESEDITFDNRGITAREYDDITGEYSSEQLRITHNILCFTNDNWESTELALGKHSYNYYKTETDGSISMDTAIGYGLTAEFVTSGHVYGTEIIGGKIYSTNYRLNTDGTETGALFNLNDGKFSFANGKLKYDGSTLSVSGSISAKSGDIGGFDIKSTYLGYGTSFGSNGTFLICPKGTVGKYTVAGTDINGWTLISGSDFGVTNTGKLYAKGAELAGKITADSGEIGGFNIETDGIYNGMVSFSDTKHNGLAVSTSGIKVRGTYGESSLVDGRIISNFLYVSSSDGTLSALFSSGSIANTVSDMQCVITPSNIVQSYGGDDVYYNMTSSGHFFKGTVYNSSGGAVFVSDRNEKNNIEPLDIENTSSFIYRLEPVSYKFNDGTSGRCHHGLIAQDVKQAMGDDDWGLYIDESINSNGETKGLRYDELIADLIATVKSQNERIKKLETMLQARD